MAILPTGYGKSLPYQLYPLVLQAMGEVKSKVIVCCPLISLMKDQVKRANAFEGITASNIGQSQDKENILSADIIFGSPEALLSSEWKDKLNDLNITVIVIDEFHLIATWGQNDKDSKLAFRRWFGEIGELRTICPGACVLALSATCTQKAKKRVMKVVTFKADHVSIFISPDKRNIKYIVKRVTNNTEMSMTWVVDGLLELGKLFPKILIYCKSISDVAKIFDYITDEVSEELRSCVAMYHSETEDAIKETILTSISDPQDKIRIMISTNALGMGVDFKNLSNVILFGPPNSMLDVVQELGRAGRNGERAMAILMYKSHHLSQCDEEVKVLYQTPECRRISMMKPFLGDNDLEQLKSDIGDHTCCDICQQKCTCKNCALLTLEKLLTGQDFSSYQLSDTSDEMSDEIIDDNKSDFEP
ncbi:hypothetical protein FSP39_019095 [Pinctada imbricata]|uniref:DNA 3'-5' helicase n=1 Tax=Pinctada imbricata TaxID=66713 RepID=A0AA89BPM4_PINIB|nr:hypothetical protein FSP39_019095 [Pinctada imbricata]